MMIDFLAMSKTATQIYKMEGEFKLSPFKIIAVYKFKSFGIYTFSKMKNR